MNSVLILAEKLIEILEHQLPLINVIPQKDDYLETIIGHMIINLNHIILAYSYKIEVMSVVIHVINLNIYIGSYFDESESEIKERRQFILNLFPDIGDISHIASMLDSSIPDIHPEDISKTTELIQKIKVLSSSHYSPALVKHEIDEYIQVIKDLLESVIMFHDIVNEIVNLLDELHFYLINLQVALQLNFEPEE